MRSSKGNSSVRVSMERVGSNLLFASKPLFDGQLAHKTVHCEPLCSTTAKSHHGRGCRQSQRRAWHSRLYPPSSSTDGNLRAAAGIPTNSSRLSTSSLAHPCRVGLAAFVYLDARPSVVVRRRRSVCPLCSDSYLPLRLAQSCYTSML